MSYDVAFENNPDLKEKYLKLSLEIKEEGKTPKELQDLIDERREVQQKIGNYEIALIQNASVVAVTATKATISKAIYEQEWDTVIFDEISMAYISQVMIAASMAKKKLVLIGDFKQLAPIVQNDNPKSLLRKDIFSYLNVVKDGTVRKHQWLVMLNVQWRMHPAIAEFANKHIYLGRLKTAEKSINTTQEIAAKAPFPNKVFVYIDYSQYQGTCFSSHTGSRFNLFSAILTVKTALLAIEDGQIDIGIVTPYAAQSQIINALLQDIEATLGVKLPIFCATIHQFQGSERDIIIFDTVENLPKRETGKIISADDDSSMRLINVALTRTRGKFIIIGNHEYLRLHQSDISPDMWELIKTAKEHCHITGEAIRDILRNSQKNLPGTIKVFDSARDALPVFREDLKKCNIKDDYHFIEYWHAPRNYFTLHPEYGFDDFLKDVIPLENTKRIYTSVNGFDGIANETSIFPRKKIRDCSIAPKDDFIFIDDLVQITKSKILWLNMIPVKSNNEIGKRIIYSLYGSNVCYQFRKLADLDYGLRLAQTKAKAAKASQGEFSTFLVKNVRCSTPGCKMSKGLKLEKAKSGKYYVKCADCGEVISQFVPNSILDEYIECNDLRCKTCGSKIKLSKYGRPYCTSEYTHSVGYDVNDIIERNPASLRKQQDKPELSKPIAHVIKKGKL